MPLAATEVLTAGDAYHIQCVTKKAKFQMQQTTSLHSKSNTTTHQYTALCDSGPSLLLCAYSTSLKTLTSELLRHVPFSQRHTGRTKSGWKTIMATVLIRRRLSRRTTTSNSKPQLDTAGTKTVPNLTYLLKKNWKIISTVSLSTVTTVKWPPHRSTTESTNDWLQTHL